MAKKVLKTALVLIIFFSVLFLSEGIYFLKTTSHIFLGDYLKKAKVEDSTGPSPTIKNQFLALALYGYLSRATVVYSDKVQCVPFCLEYEMGEKIIEIFNSLSKTSLSPLVPSQKAKIYFWAATINVRREEDEKTLEWLKSSTKLDPSNSSYHSFYEDLNKLQFLETEETAQDYFINQIKNKKEAHVYQKVLLAKAAAKLANDFNAEGNAEEAVYFFEKAILLNPWNLDYYIALSDLQLSRGARKEARITLESCIRALPKDSTHCREALAKIPPL